MPADLHGYVEGNALEMSSSKSPIVSAVVLWLCSVWLLPIAFAQSDYYVKPGGTGQGTSPAGAFGSIEQARNAIRSRTAESIKSDITVHLLPGTYFLEKPIAFDSHDSGKNGFKVIYRAEDEMSRPIISGGRRIVGPWAEVKGMPGVYSAPAGPGVFRQLYINDLPAVQSREPDQGWKELKQWEDAYGSKSVRLKGPDNLSKSWQRQNQIEFVTKFHWALARIHLGPWNTYDNDNVIFPPDKNVWRAIAPRTKDQFYFLENALEFLDEPGEWYLDRTSPEHRVYYKPRPGEDLAKATVITSNLENLFSIQGADGTHPVQDLVFKGLAFEHSQWLHTKDNDGYVGAQGQIRMNDWSAGPAAMELTYTQGIQIKGCLFRNLGQSAIRLARGTEKTLIEGNMISHIGDTGVLVYASKKIDTQKESVPLTDQCRGDVIRNNYIEKTGRETLQGPGIAVVMGRDIVVEHNEVFDTPYAGITFGYFTSPSSISVSCKVQYNYVHHAMTELDDGAGIYIFHTKFDLPPSGSRLLVARNFIHDVYRGKQSDHNPIAGIYFDEGTRDIILKENVVRGVGNWLHLNTGGGKERETLTNRPILSTTPPGTGRRKSAVHS